jgi:polysaccharide export outer membrane protein
MKKILLSILVLTTILSCRSTKDLVYLKDVAPGEVIQGLPIQTTNHIVGTGDILYVSIKSTNAEVNQLYNPESTMESSASQSYMKFSTPSGAYLYGFEVDKDGNIKLPMLGKIKVVGNTQTQVELLVQKKADEALTDAIVKVKLLNFKITVMGEVRNPGVYYNYNNSINLMEAIAMAMGNTDFATINDVMVVRPTADGNKTYLIDLSSREAYLSEGFYLHPNDNIIVRPDKQKNLQLNSQARGLFFTSVSTILSVITLILVLK